MLNKKIILQISSLVLLIVFSVVITILYLNGKAGGENVSVKSTENEVSGKAVDLSEFIQNGYFKDTGQLKPVFLRARHKKWSEAEVKKYWIDPDKIIGNILKKENEQRIRKLLQ
ncbi:MAG: hypothetical protein GXP33_13390 [Spirochaetes bacterium]|nr:hypothetical protein [Spirochaetota bacterium]